MEFHKVFKFKSVTERKSMDKWMQDFDVEIVADIDAGMYGNRYIDWKSPTLTSNKVVRGSGYNSLHGTFTRTFTSKDMNKIC